VLLSPVVHRLEKGCVGDVQQKKKKETENYRPDFSSEMVFHVIKSITVKVKVTLQLTVSQSLCQGIEPILGLVTDITFCPKVF
jgi:hypothetical protein